MSSPTIAVQLYSLRSLEGLKAQLEVASRAGFTAVELIETQITDGQKTRANLDVLGLKAPSVHVSLAALRERPGEIVAGARTAGADCLVIPSPPFGAAGTDSQGWRALGRELGGLAARLIDTGLALCYHNHSWELQPLADGSRPLDLLLAEGAEGGLRWQADVAWLVRGGGDPQVWLDRYAERLDSVHVKDIAREGEAADEDGWADVGHGTLDWPDLWLKCMTNGVDLMVAEHDRPSDPSRFARRSFVNMVQMAERSAP